MRRAAVLLLLALAACARPLTPDETNFAHALFGDSLDTSKIRITQGLGVAPLYRTVPDKLQALRGTTKACIRTPQPRGAQPPEAFSLWNTIHFDSELYSSDMALTWPKGLRYPQAIVLAHELTHVWQWQHRKLTGYTPMRAAAESWRLADPYYSKSTDAPAFLAFGYEQQAAMVEDYVCFAVANPTNPRRRALRRILEPVLPMDHFDEAIGR